MEVQRGERSLGHIGGGFCLKRKIPEPKTMLGTLKAVQTPVLNRCVPVSTCPCLGQGREC